MKAKTSNLKKRNLHLLPIIFIGLTAFFIKMPFTMQGFFAFTYDQGRDFLEVSKIIYEKNFTLIGPTTGQPGIFYGPWWYYFLSPLIYFSNGDPQFVGNFFGMIGVITPICIYLLLKHSGINLVVVLGLSLFSAMSATWMLGPTIIWSPSLTPLLMIVYILNIAVIFSKAKPINYFLLGLITLLIADTGAAYGSVLTIFLLVLPFLFKKNFLKKEFLLVVVGALIALFPRIIFDLRNNFLISSNIFNLFTNPNYYNAEESVFVRLIQRLDHFWGLFSWTFTRGNKNLGALLLIVLLLLIILILRNKKVFKKLISDKLTIFLSALLIFQLITFTYYKDIIWDHYLVGLPIIFVILVSRVLHFSYEVKTLKVVTLLILAFLLILNFHTKIFPPYKLTWQGDGSTYRNPRMVMEYILLKNPKNYSYYAYSPAIFDYPFDYLFIWYSRQNLIEKPKDNQNLIYLIIREESSNRYKSTGWYGDKTKDKTSLLERKIFPGDLVLEIHQKNE